MAGTKDFGSADVQKASDAELTTTITNGKPPKMPAYKGKLTADQIKDSGHLRPHFRSNPSRRVRRKGKSMDHAES